MWWRSYNSRAFTTQRKTRCWRAFLLWCFDFRQWTFQICTSLNIDRSIDRNWLNWENIRERKMRSRTKCSFVCYLSCKTIWRCFVLLRSSNSLNRWQKWISRTSCKRWTSICFVRCVENRSCSKFNTRFNETVASSDTEAGLRDHVMWLQSRDVAKVAVYRAGQLRPGHLNIYRGSLTLDRTLDNTTMRSIIYLWQIMSSNCLDVSTY
jgi:hypothetical protein